MVKEKKLTMNTKNIPCIKVLPTIYEESLSYYEVLCKMRIAINEMGDVINKLPDYIRSLLTDDELKSIYSELLNELEEQIASENEKDNTTATKNRNIGDLVWLNGILIEIISPMIAGDKYVENSNYITMTMEDYINNIKINLSNSINELENADKAIIELINTIKATIPSKFTAEDFGILPNGDDCSDKVNEVLANYHYIYFLNGTYTFSKSINVNGGCTIIGNNTTLLFTESVNGINIKQDIESGSKDNIYISNINIVTSATVSNNVGISINGTNSISDRWTLSPKIENVNISSDNVTNSGNYIGWYVGISLYQCNGINIKSCSLTGASIGGDVSNISNFGIYIEGINNPRSTEFIISDCKVTAFEHGIGGKMFEGLIVTSCIIINCKFGIFHTAESIVPHLTVINTHINSQHCCIYAENIYQININNNLLYCNADGDGKRIIELTNSGSDIISNNNFIILNDKSNITGIYLSKCIIFGISNNNFNFSGNNSTAMYCDNNCNNARINSNNFINVITPLLSYGMNIRTDINVQSIDILAGEHFNINNITCYSIGNGLILNGAVIANTNTNVNDTIFTISTNCKLLDATRSVYVNSNTIVNIHNDENGLIACNENVSTGQVIPLNIFIKYAE